ncbi:MAG: Trk system potassium transporter TrkA, partial [Oleispira sp.]|nr:Trk system potassium transporter TrkA [Oleispira sp.]
MKIIILGAGQVGGTLAENLANEQNDITVVDTDSQRLRELQDSIDIKTVTGTASYPQVLRQAGADDADMLIAVTNSDETNMVACQIAYTLFRTPTKISRIRSNAYLKQKDLFKSDAFPIDVLISPEQVVTNYIKRLLEYPGTLQVLDFADEKVQLVAVRAYHGGLLVGQELRKLKEHMPSADTKVAAIYRRGQAILPSGETVIEVDDEVFFIAAKNHIKKVMSELRREEHSYKRILIAGGGNIGYRLAKTLETKYRLKLIEHGRGRAKFLSENLAKTVVLMGSATDQALLEEENIENIDVFCAVTNDDETNIMSSMLAKRLGARKVMTLINKAAYVDLVQGGVIDVAISPQQTTIGSLLTHVR